MDNLHAYCMSLDPMGRWLVFLAVSGVMIAIPALGLAILKVWAEAIRR